MKLHSNSRRVLFKDLKGDQYGLKELTQDSVKGFLDIGANSGFVSITARILHPEMKIVAVEPHPRVYADMVDNVSRLQIKTMNVALGDGSTFYLLKERKMDLCNHFTPEPGIAGKAVPIQSMRLDDVLRRSGLDPSSLCVKVDCEGAEEYLVGHLPSEKIIVGSTLFCGEFHTNQARDITGYFKWVLDLLQGTHTVTIERTAIGLGRVKAFKKA